MNDIYNQGFAAFTDGKDYNDNEYPATSRHHRDWADGWTAASSEKDRDEDFFGSDEDEENLARYEDWINE
jgi:hypothetical protein